EHVARDAGIAQKDAERDADRQGQEKAPEEFGEADAGVMEEIVREKDFYGSLEHERGLAGEAPVHPAHFRGNLPEYEENQHRSDTDERRTAPPAELERSCAAIGGLGHRRCVHHTASRTSCMLAMSAARWLRSRLRYVLNSSLSRMSAR